MIPPDVRRVLRERKRELRRSVALRRKEARDQLRSAPAVRRAQMRRRVRRAVGFSALVLLAAFLRCECPKPPTPPPAPAKEAVPSKPEARVKVAVPPKAKQPPVGGVLETQPRPKYQGSASAPPTWLDEFHLQVAARSPRLAECFTGAERPGALRWTAAVNPRSGAVSDHELEPVRPGSILDAKQRECVLRVLSSPSYRLSAPPTPEALPSRVSLVIEF